MNNRNVNKMRNNYYCWKCKINHFYDSKIGIRHNKPKPVIPEYIQKTNVLNYIGTHDNEDLNILAQMFDTKRDVIRQLTDELEQEELIKRHSSGFVAGGPDEFSITTKGAIMSNSPEVKANRITDLQKEKQISLEIADDYIKEAETGIQMKSVSSFNVNYKVNPVEDRELAIKYKNNAKLMDEICEVVKTSNEQKRKDMLSSMKENNPNRYWLK